MLKQFWLRLQGKRRKRQAFTCARRLCLEALEDRQMLATYVVNNILDTSTLSGTLRNAIQLSNQTQTEHDIIVFDLNASQMAAGISLINGPLVITNSVRIIGPSSGNRVKINGGPTASIAFDLQMTSGGATDTLLRYLDISDFDKAINVGKIQLNAGGTGWRPSHTSVALATRGASRAQSLVPLAPPRSPACWQSRPTPASVSWAACTTPNTMPSDAKGRQ
ncbi:MAG TPA: hypothetical protein PJ982_04210 [Lacipirellulaceae bacterium]|nr:hypothetical protein [Lacipirellulaceae bacterium]